MNEKKSLKFFLFIIRSRRFAEIGEGTGRIGVVVCTGLREIPEVPVLETGVLQARVAALEF
jgi:hypothetical protein